MKDKVVIITGSSYGIGKALAFEFGSKNAKVVIAARNKEKLEIVEKELKSKNIDCLSVVTDVTDEKSCENLINKTLEKYNRIDILINNAGISMRALFLDLDLDVLKKVMDTNFWGTVYCTKFALPHLLKVGGSLVGIISIAGYIGLPARTGYSASKYAVRGFLDTIRVEHLKQGLHVLVAAPGFTASEIRTHALTHDGSKQGFTPRDENKMMSAEKVANKVYRAVAKRKRQLILTFIEGKFTVFLSKWAPALLDKLNYNHMKKEDKNPLV